MTTSPGNALEIGAVRTALKKNYDILEELGRGGMAVVYRARERALDREVAIKVLPAAMTFDAEFIERFQREARTAGQLEHPNIVPIYRVGRSGKVIYFVMKFLRGQSLARVLRERGKLTASEVRHILLDTASALGYASRRGVVHRDIKPDNILLDQDGRCVVTDFGIAKTQTGPRTAAGTSMGTPRYMSPEHAQGTPVDGRSDIYSLGIVAYQCLSGTIPFDGEDPFAVLYKHINSPLPRPALTSDEEWKMYAVIERMLAKKPGDRFQSADDVTIALGGQAPINTLITTKPPRISKVTPTEIITTPLPMPVRSHVLADWRFWAGAAGVVLISTGAYFARPVNPAEPQVELAGAASAGDSAAGFAALATAPPPMMFPPALVMAIRPPPPAVAARPAASEPFSRCPRLDSPAMKGGTLALLVDSVGAQRPGSRLQVSYDVCGLAKGAPYETNITVSRIRQPRLRRLVGGTVKPLTARYLDNASSARTRLRRTIDLAGLPPGVYSLEVVVTDAKERRQETSRQFEIDE